MTTLIGYLGDDVLIPLVKICAHDFNWFKVDQLTALEAGYSMIELYGNFGYEQLNKKTLVFVFKCIPKRYIYI